MDGSQTQPRALLEPGQIEMLGGKWGCQKRRAQLQAWAGKGPARQHAAFTGGEMCGAGSQLKACRQAGAEREGAASIRNRSASRR